MLPSYLFQSEQVCGFLFLLVCFFDGTPVHKLAASHTSHIRRKPGSTYFLPHMFVYTLQRLHRDTQASFIPGCVSFVAQKNICFCTLRNYIILYLSVSISLLQY